MTAPFLSLGKKIPFISFLVLSVFTLLCSFGAWAKPPIPLGEVNHLYDLTSGADTPLSLPTDIAIGKDDRAYVVDSANHRILGFEAGGKFLFAVGRQGDGEGEFNWPVGIGTDREGLVYVADKDNGRIQVFDPQGRFKSAFEVRDVQGRPGRPVDIAVSASSGLVFVTDADNHQVLVFERDGTLLGGWGDKGVKDGQFRYPATLAASKAEVLVVDVMNTVVKIFDERGIIQHKVGAWGVEPGQFFRPKGVALDSRGWIYVTDSYMEVVEVFDDNFQFQYVLATQGAKHPFTTPVGMAVDSKDRLYVAEMLSNKVSVFKLR